MTVTCPSCGNHKHFLVPQWMRCTFKFTEQGNISILHVKPLESLEEKLTDQNTYPSLTCQECGADAIINFNPYERLDEESRELQTLRSL